MDAQLPRGGGPMVSRLQAAEQNLASLEELVPLETRRNSARQQATTAGSRIAEVTQEYKAARRCSREALAAAGLPGKMSARQARLLSGHWQGLAESEHRLDQLREQARNGRRQWDLLASRVAQVASEAGVGLDGTDATEHLKQLADVLALQKTDMDKRETIRARIRRLRLRRTKHEEAAARHKHRRRELFFQAGAEDETQFRRRACEHARANDLLRKRNALGEEIAAAIGNQCSEQAVGAQIQKESPAGLEALAAAMKDRLAAAETQIRQRMEKRGELSANIQSLVQDRQLPVKRLELAMIEKRLELAIDRWQVLAAACRILDRIRSAYETSRQPETLQQASGISRALDARPVPPGLDAAGRKCAAGGRCRGPVHARREPEPRHARAVVPQPAHGLGRRICERGAALPLVLDDVLVNFDAERAATAAAALRDFAAAGHQLLVFTCHQHISNIFASLGVPVGILPSASNAKAALISFEMAAESEEKTQSEVKRTRRPSTRRKTPAKIKTLPEELESAPMPADQITPIVKPEAKHKPSQVIKPETKTRGVFDADFFDSSENKDSHAESENQEEEPSASVGHRSIWETSPDEADENYQFNDDNSAEAA